MLVLAALIIELTTAVQFYSLKQHLSSELTEVTKHDILSIEDMAELKAEVADEVGVMLPELERLYNEQKFDSIKMFIHDWLMEDTYIIGIQLCEKEKKGEDLEGFYMYKDSDSDKIYYQIMDFDFTSRSWYSEGIKSDNFWSEPYKARFNVMWMTTFSRAVYNDKHEVVAVIGADVPLNEISAIADQLFNDQANVIIPIILLHLLGITLIGYLIYRTIVSEKRLLSVGRERELMETELNIAKNIQQAMLSKTFPPFPQRKDCDVYAFLKPAKEVGGDFYDFLIRDEKLFFCIGDVAGKGVPAALVMTVVTSMFRMLSAREAAPDRIVSDMNEEFGNNNEYNIFITAFIGVLDLPTGRLRFCNAGHCSPLINAQPIEVEANLPIGAFPDFRYSGQERMIKPGDDIFLFTDGLSEAVDANENMFGMERITESCRKYREDPTSNNPKGITEGTVESAKQFIGDNMLSDDLTILAIKYTRQPNGVLISKSINMPCDLAEIPRLADFVNEICETLNLSPTTTMQMNVAIEEAVVNVMSYAYPKGVVGDVTVEATASKERLKITIIDTGKPFDPTTRGNVDITQPVEERTIGGLGIHLMRLYMDSINYERFEGKNILTLRKTIDNEIKS